jgi:16S rRNA (cytosine967-C5)-methyltransferase
MLVARALQPRPGQRVLDLCAAPGGKSTHLAALMQGRGEILAVESNARRARVLIRTARRLGAQNVRVEVADARRLELLGAADGGPRSRERAFDRVLVDPPCSGLGTLQGHPDLRWRMTPSRMRELAREQAAILECGAAALRPGGLLVYSTCTISSIENEGLICAFLDSHRDFKLQDLGGEWPALRMKRAGAECRHAPEPGRLVLTLPHRDRTAGFFIARLYRS